MADSYGNSVLYRMCAEKPEHKVPDIIKGKMWLIGRSYSASPERTQGAKPLPIASEEKKHTDSDFFAEIAESIANDPSSNELDVKIELLRDCSYKYTGLDEDFSLLAETIALSKLLNELIKKASNKYNEGKWDGERKANNNISFVSKYLHFHLPEIVFIQDQYSFDNAKGVGGKKNIEGEILKFEYSNYKKSRKERERFVKNLGPICKDYKNHAEHVLRCYFIAHRKNEQGIHRNLPRVVDDILMKR